MRPFLCFCVIVLIALVCVAADDAVASSFAFDDEGWSATHDDAAISFVSHSVRLFCKNRNDVSFVAPSKFLGQQRALFGGRIELRLGFYEYNSDGKDFISGYDVIIDSERTGFSLGLQGVVKPWDFVTEANITVDAASGWQHVTNGAAASTPEMQRTLASISRVRVRACYYSGHQDVYVAKMKFLKSSAAKPDKTSVKSSKQPGRDRSDDDESQSAFPQPPTRAHKQDVQNEVPDASAQSASAAQIPSAPVAESTLTEEQQRNLNDQKFQQRQFEQQQDMLRQQQRKVLRDTPADEAALEKLRAAAGGFLTTYISGRGHALGLTSTSLFYSNGHDFESRPLSDITSVTVGDDGNVHIRSGETTLLAAGPMNVYSVRDLGAFFEKVHHPPPACLPLLQLACAAHVSWKHSSHCVTHSHSCAASGSFSDQVQQAARPLMKKHEQATCHGRGGDGGSFLEAIGARALAR